MQIAGKTLSTLKAVDRKLHVHADCFLSPTLSIYLVLSLHFSLILFNTKYVHKHKKVHELTASCVFLVVKFTNDSIV